MAWEPPHPLPCTRYTPGTPCSPASVQKCHPAAWSPSPTLPTSNDHDHDLMSYGRCRWERGMKRMEKGKELKP